jgi:hypothetical protein
MVACLAAAAEAAKAAGAAIAATASAPLVIGSAGAAAFVTIGAYGYVNTTYELPEYPMPAGYEPDSVQATYILPGSNTLSLDSPMQPSESLIDEARPNQQGNRGADPAYKRGGQNAHLGGPKRDDPREVPFDRVRRDPAPDLDLGNSDDALDNLDPSKVGWRTFFFLKVLQLIGETLGE